jgi:hypothetical protein
MTIYHHPVKTLLTEWAGENLVPGQKFGKDDAARWFAQRYPKIKGATVNAHVEIMCVNNRLRKHYPNVKPGSGHDLFYKLGPDDYRLWNVNADPRPRYWTDFAADTPHSGSIASDEDAAEGIEIPGEHEGVTVRSGDVGTPNVAHPSILHDVDLAGALVLVSCVKSKLPHPAPARSLYTSAWFQKARDIVERSGARWFVLSSRYGLESPDTTIAD